MSAVIEALRSLPLDFPLDVAARRETLDAFMAGPLVEGTQERAATLGGRPAAWFTPTNGPSGEPGTGPVVLYLHGGAYEVGSITAYRHLASELAVLLDAAVVVVEYRLAPEHPFPAAVDDALAAYRELLDGGHDPAAIALIGDSAGGGLVAATLLAAGRAGLAQPAAGVCLSPWTDLTQTAASYERCAATDPFFDRARAQQSAVTYLAGADPRDPLASPALAPLDELGALAPLMIQASAAEVLADDAALLGRRVEEAGGEVRCELWPDLTHVWQSMDPSIPEVRDARAAIADFLRTHWSDRP